MNWSGRIRNEKLREHVQRKQYIIRAPKSKTVERDEISDVEQIQEQMKQVIVINARMNWLNHKVKDAVQLRDSAWKDVFIRSNIKNLEIKMYENLRRGRGREKR